MDAPSATPVSTASRVAWNTSVQAGARFAAVALGLLTTVVLTRHLGVQAYGDYVTITIYVGLFAVLLDWGTATILVRELAARREAAHDLVAKALALRALLSVGVAVVAASLLPLLYGGVERVRLGVLVALPFLLFNAVGTTVAAYFQSELKMGRVAAGELTGQAVGTGVIVALVLLDRSFYEIVAAFALAGAANAAVVVSLAYGRVPLRPTVDLAAWRRLFVTALPLGIALLLNAVYFRLDALLLSVLRDSHEVGIYGVAYRFLEVTVPFSHFLVLALFPLLAAAAHDGAWDALRRGTQRGFDVLVVVAVPIVLGTIAVAPELVPLLVGRDFEESVLPVRIVIVGAGLLFLTWLLVYLLVAIGRQQAVLWLNAGVLAFNVVLNLLLIPRYGYVAAASVATASEVVVLAGALVLARRFAGFVPSLSVAARAVGAGGALFAAAAMLPGPLPFRIAAGALVYAAGLYVLRVPRALGIGAVIADLRRR
ncbi:MAG TPA: oligosaccharide flippase family protein [Gaiellaceae bacterium]|nr:oligosaccharide flippase family protein [Gaiellaceae bacterium]